MKMSMKSMKTILACACAALAVSCAENNENVKPVAKTRTVTLTANRDQIAGNTRTQLNGLEVFWEKDDVITLLYKNKEGEFHQAGELHTVTLNGSKAVFSGECTFTNEAEEPEYIAAYPSASLGSSESNELSFPNWPVQTIKKEGAFAATNPSVAYGRDLNNMQFENIFGVLKFRYKSDSRIIMGLLSINGFEPSDDPFNGTYYFNPITKESRLVPAPGTGLPPSILIQEDTNMALKEWHTVYMPLAPTTLNGISVTFLDENDEFIFEKSSSKPLEIKAGVITDLGDFEMKQPTAGN